MDIVSQRKTPSPLAGEGCAGLARREPSLAGAGWGVARREPRSAIALKIGERAQCQRDSAEPIGSKAISFRCEPSRFRAVALCRARAPIGARPPHPAAPKLTTFAKAPHPSPARGEGE